MATAMPAAKGLGPGDQSIVPDEGENFFKKKSHAVPFHSTVQVQFT